MRLCPPITYLLLTTALAALVGCTTTPMTREQKEQVVRSKAYETITSSRTDSGSKK